MPRNKAALLLGGVLLLAGCATAPRYERPAVATAAAYKELGP